MIERLLVLILACCVFLGVWRHDARKQQSWRAAQRRHQAQADDPGRRVDRVSRWTTDDQLGNPMAATGTRERTPTLADGTERRLPPGVPLDEASAVVLPLDLPLPSVIVPGDFRVINHRGFVGRMRIADTDLAILGLSRGQRPQNLHTIVTPDGPWYLIRITSHPTSASVAADATDKSQPTARVTRWLATTEQILEAASKFYRSELSRQRRSVTSGVVRLVHRGGQRIVNRWNTWQARTQLSGQPSATLR